MSDKQLYTNKMLNSILGENTYYPIADHLDCNISESALQIMEKCYLKGESPHQLFQRVATAVAKPLKEKLDADDFEKVRFIFYNIMASRDFMPNSPTLMNAGRAFNQLAACFVVPVEDSMEGIFRDAIADMALIQRTGGGTGFDFSKLRPKGAIVSSTMGESSGPLPFMRAFNSCTDTVKQGGARRGANMGILRVDHPDIRDFIMVKSDLNEMTNFNLSVAITDAFMTALAAEDDTYDLVHNETVYGQDHAREIWDLIATRSWTTGEPGVIFIDTVNKYNTLPGLGPIAATNPCGEQPLLPHEACNLGSINLRHCVTAENEVDFDKIKALTSIAVLFLDCVIDAGCYPLPQITEMAKANRKIGLGIMGFADLCYMLEIPYDAPEATRIAEQIMQVISITAKATSSKLGECFGNFPNHNKSTFGAKPMRNAALTTIAPTGTISMIAGASYGIEPFFALHYTKYLTEGGVANGGTIHVINEHINTFMTKHNFTTQLREAIEQYIISNSSIKGLYDAVLSISGKDQKAVLLMEDVFVTAQDIRPADHVHIQAAFQKFTDNAVSKTINFQNNVSKEDIQKMYLLAYKSGCKGITVYRDGCRDTQPLKVDKPAKVDASNWGDSITTHVVQRRPKELSGITRQIPTGCGMMLVTVNMDENGRVFEVLMRAGASGGCSAYTDAVARLISIALRHGVPIETIIDQLRSVRCDNFRYQSGKDSSLKGKSCPDVVGKFLQEIIDSNNSVPKDASSVESVLDAPDLQSVKIGGQSLAALIEQAFKNTGATCPECGSLLKHAEGCLVCQCGYSKC